MEKIKIVVFLVILVAITFVVSYLSFNWFYNKEPRLVNSLDIHLRNNTDLNENNDANVATFILSNDSNFAIDYKVLLKDNSSNKDGVNRKYISYKLRLGDKLIKSGKLSELKDDILLSGSIDGESKYTYSLELILDDTADLGGKYYRCDLTVEPIM